MNRVVRIIVILAALVVVVGAAGFAYIWFSGGDGTASQAITADVVEASGEGQVYEIAQAESEVRFIIDEVLRGSPFTVVGATNEVAGQIVFDAANPQNAELGAIRINVRTLETDDSMRNRTIRSQILHSAEDAFEFAEFVPTALEGLPETVTMGEPFTFQIVGDLTLRGVTNSVTFDATVIPSESRLEGSATATVRYADFNLTIPEVRHVQEVSDEVALEIDFVAVPVESETAMAHAVKAVHAAK